MELNRIINDDCLNVMKQIPDKYFDLCLTDPPYGGGAEDTWKGKGRSRFGGLFDKYHIEETKCERTGGTWSKKYQEGKQNIKHWDFAPTKEYFDEMFRVSKGLVIWGGNYFSLPPTRCFLVWDKLTIAESFSMAMCEYAWTSFNGNAKRFECAPQDSKRFHPTQKPEALISWVLKLFSKEGDKVFDPFSGSGTTAIACHRGKRQFLCVEKDKVYFQKSVERLEEERKQMILL